MNKILRDIEEEIPAPISECDKCGEAVVETNINEIHGQKICDLCMDERSEDYPIGSMIEPYDREMEKDL